MSGFNSHKRITGVGGVTNAAKTAAILTAVSGKIIYFKKFTVVCTLAATGGGGLITIRNGTGGTIITQMDGNTLNTKMDVDLDDELGYPLSSGQPLSLEVSGAGTDEASATAYAIGRIEY